MLPIGIFSSDEPSSKGLLLDMDGVILDTFALERDLIDPILASRAPGSKQVDPELIASLFAHPIPVFWGLIAEASGIEADESMIAELTADLVTARETAEAKVLPGIRDLIDRCPSDLPIAVVSNNPVSHTRVMLGNAGLLDRVGVIVGNDEGLDPKPAPAMYLEACSRIDRLPSDCTVIEDSLVGSRAGRDAGCRVIGVATGGTSFEELSGSDAVDVACLTLEDSSVEIEPGDVTDKQLDSPNEFVSHMVEHIAWRTGRRVRLDWRTDDWALLGRIIGGSLATDAEDGSATAVGLIDDGFAEVTLTASDSPEALIEGPGSDWLVGLRVEQLATGAPLVDLIRGLAQGSGFSIGVTIALPRDPHHCWEAIFRGIGSAFFDLLPEGQRSSTDLADAVAPEPTEPRTHPRGVEVELSSPVAVRLERRTAESVASVDLRVGGDGLQVQVEESDSVDLTGLSDPVETMLSAAGVAGSVAFRPLALESSHVALEDIGITLGLAAAEVARERMAATGIQGYGWSGTGQVSGGESGVRVALSWEGRRTVRLASRSLSDEQLTRAIVGSTLANGLFSEDLDDFLEGFSGGMSASLFVMFDDLSNADESWRRVFEGLGESLGMLLEPNPSRRGLISGVKATLA